MGDGGVESSRDEVSVKKKVHSVTGGEVSCYRERGILLYWERYPVTGGEGSCYRGVIQGERDPVTGQGCRHRGREILLQGERYR
jgi:hypothetical protein